MRGLTIEVVGISEREANDMAAEQKRTEDWYRLDLSAIVYPTLQRPVFPLTKLPYERACSGDIWSLTTDPVPLCSRM